jgi:two-component system, OmpR family, phosphate regulon sensor histidine kinase PhoR
LFWKLLIAVSALALLVILVLTWISSTAYRALLERELDNRLRDEAASLAVILADDWPSEPNDATQSLVHRIGDRTDLRLTLIAPDGRVLADSYSKGADAVRKIENHRNRKEFLDAVRTGQGSAQRVSPTVGERFWYRAVRVDVDGKPAGVVRTALPAAPVTAEIEGLTRWIWTIGLLVAATAIAITYWAAARWTDPLRHLAATAEALAAGQYDRRLPVSAGAHDEVGAIAAALNDLGKRLAQRERQLQNTSQTQATVLEGMTESVIAVDRGEKILFANASAGRALGFNAKKVEDLTLLEAVRSHELRAIMQKALRSKQLCNAELTWRGKSLHVFDVLATPLPGDPPPGVVLVLRDISELKRLEQMRQQFIANVSHELKTPLSSIKAYTETLLAGASKDPVHCERFLNRIDEQAGHLHQLIMDMLSLARIEASQSSMELANVPVDGVVRRCLADYEPQAAARQVALESVSNDTNIRVRADEEGLRQILSNLIDNAIKYTPAGGRVTVDCRADGATVTIEVADTGVGIAQEHHDRLFERFYRVDKARSRELGGTGLGLSIVKHLTQSMGGSVTVASQVGTGSRFTVRLPLGGG